MSNVTVTQDTAYRLESQLYVNDMLISDLEDRITKQVGNLVENKITDSLPDRNLSALMEEKLKLMKESVALYECLLKLHAQMGVEKNG